MTDFLRKFFKTILVTLRVYASNLLRRSCSFLAFSFQLTLVLRIEIIKLFFALFHILFYKNNIVHLMADEINSQWNSINYLTRSVYVKLLNPSLSLYFIVFFRFFNFKQTNNYRSIDWKTKLLYATIESMIFNLGGLFRLGCWYLGREKKTKIKKKTGKKLFFINHILNTDNDGHLRITETKTLSEQQQKIIIYFRNTI